MKVRSLNKCTCLFRREKGLYMTHSWTQGLFTSWKAKQQHKTCHQKVRLHYDNCRRPFSARAPNRDLFWDTLDGIWGHFTGSKHSTSPIILWFWGPIGRDCHPIPRLAETFSTLCNHCAEFDNNLNEENAKLSTCNKFVFFESMGKQRWTTRRHKHGREHWVGVLASRQVSSKFVKVLQRKSYVSANQKSGCRSLFDNRLNVILFIATFKQDISEIVVTRPSPDPLHGTRALAWH